MAVLKKSQKLTKVHEGPPRHAAKYDFYMNGYMNGPFR